MILAPAPCCKSKDGTGFLYAELSSLLQKFSECTTIWQLTYAKYFWKWGPLMILGAPFLDFNCLFPKPIQHDKKSFGLQFAKTGARRNGEKWSEWTEKVSMVDSFIFIYDFCDWKPHRLQFVHLQLFKTLSNLKFLSQLTISHRGQWNSTTWSVMHCWGWGSE